RGRLDHRPCLSSSAGGSLGLRQQNAVLSEAPQCQAAQCPIHQGYGSSCCHEEDDVFSDCAPPPVPRKKLVRTRSLPEGYNPPTYPQRAPTPRVSVGRVKKHHGNAQSFDNPLYMLRPLEDALSPEHREEPRAAGGNPHSLLPASTGGDPTTALSRLSFDTPDEQVLPYLGSDAAGVSQCIEQRHMLFLRSAARTVEQANLLPHQGEAGGGICGVSYTPDHFQLCDGYKPRHIGEDVYYKLHCSTFPNKVLGARVYNLDDQSSTTRSIPQPPHVNMQQVLVHFSPSSSRTQEATRVLTGTHDSQPDCTPPRRPLGGGSESVDSQLVPPKNNYPTIIELLERGHSVSVERDLPQATLEDFIRCRCAMQTSDPALYAKQLCVLLLQVVTGLQQLCTDQVMYIELRPSNVFLVWPSRAPTESDRAERGDFVKDKEQEGSENGHAGIEAAQINWEILGAPRVVLPNPRGRTLSKHHTQSSTNAQIGGLIQHGLNPGESLTSFSKSTHDPYTERLLDLAGWLQNESSALKLSDIKAFLQAFLWGPGAQLFTINTGAHVDAWLTIRRALLVLKMAERRLLRGGPPLDWEECLCLQYFASCDGEGLRNAFERQGLLQKL
ncbi:hypothetical protein NHX12_033903, partial [Muraenolepis orangiensis]